MKKLLLGVGLWLLAFQSNAQYDYHLNGKNDVPVLGACAGLTAGGFTAMLKNRDDMNADDRLNPQTMNFSYGGGFEQMWWFQPSIGFGFQFLYWQGGAAYTGLDTITKLSMKGNTSLTYYKIPLLFYFKSFNRYHPNQTIRFNACFGPYIALTNDWSDNVSYFDDKGVPVYSASWTPGGVSANSMVSGKIKNPIYNPLDFGFVLGVGGEIRVSKRSVLSLMLRADLGIWDVENKKKNKFLATGSTVEQDIEHWKGLYAKYTAPNFFDQAFGWESNRPATKNLSIGAFLTYRKYFRKF